MARQRPLPLIVCLVIALAVASLSGVAALRKIATFQPLGFEAVRVEGHFAVTKVTDPAVGLRVGDQILLVDGVSAVTYKTGELARQLRLQPTSKLTTLRDATLQVVAYERPPLEIDFPYLILGLVGAFSLLIGLYTLLRHRTPSSTLFSLWCSGTAALYLLSAVPPYPETLDRIIYLADQTARNLLPALTLHFFLLFPAPMPWLDASRRRRWLAFLYLPGAVLLTLTLDLVLAGGRFAFGRVSTEAILWLDRLDLLHVTAGIVLVIALLAHRLARSRSWEERRQLQWIALGVSLGYVPFLLLGALPSALRLSTPQLLSTAAVLPLALVPLTFAYAILRYKLWDIEVVARDTISATVTLLLGMIGFGLAYLALDRVPAVAGLHSFLSIAAGLVIAGLLVPTRHTVSAALERLQYRGTFGKRRELLSFGRELLHERDLGRLSSSLLERIEAGVGIEQINLYLLQRGRLTAVRPEPCLPESLPAERLTPEMLEGELFELAQAADSPFERSPQADLFEAGYRYAFPLTVRGRSIGVLLAGVKPEGIPLNSDDLDLIRHLLDQAALAIENAQLVGQLQSQLAQVESLKSYSEGIFESSPAGIAVLDAAQTIVSANSTFAAIAGSARQALIGRPISQVLPIWPFPDLGAAPIETSYCEASGLERHLQVSRAAFDDCPRGQAMSILVVHDVSARAEMERELKEKERLAALGMLAAGVAHEVNTPITGISSYAQMLLADTPENDPRHGLLKKVEQQTFRAARIVNNLLETARNRQEERRDVLVEPLLAECLDLFADRLARRHIEVVRELADDAGSLAVWAAEGELQQVLTNLVGNAIDAMTGGGRSGGTLTLALSGDETTVRLRVADTGPGIPENHLASIFEPFFSTKTSRGGTGLGLAISRSLVESHQGHLSVTSQAGQGTCFTVELPRRAGTMTP